MSPCRERLEICGGERGAGSAFLRRGEPGRCPVLITYVHCLPKSVTKKAHRRPPALLVFADNRLIALPMGPSQQSSLSSL